MIECRRVARFGPPLLAAALAAACSAAGDGESADRIAGEATIGEVGRELAVWPNLNYFPLDANGKYTVNICFFGDASTSRRQLVQDALTGSWESAANIDFVFQGTCAAPPSSWMPINLKYMPGSGRSAGVCPAGVGARLPGTNYQCELGYTDDLENIQTVAVHEVGHGLGFRHEHGRDDWPGRAAGVWNAAPPAAGTTRDAWGCDRHSSGAFNDPDGVVFKDNTGVHNIYHPVETGPRTTRLDVTSIMAPWRCDPYRRDPNPAVPLGANNWSLSDMDRLGAEILYPYSLARPIRALNGFITGSGILTRSNDTLVPDWTFRGANDDVYDTGPNWQWGSSQISGIRPPVSAFGSSGSVSIRLFFWDLLGRLFDKQTTVVIDNSAHAAIVSVLVNR